MPLIDLAALAIAQAISTGDRLVGLRGLRAGEALPSAVVLKDNEQHGSIAFSFYAPRRDRDGASMGWRARREVREAGASPEIAWASQDSCPGMADALAALERTPAPRVELRSAAPLSSQPPSMGPLHTSHLIWMRAWDDGNSPVEMTLTSLGAGSPERVFTRVEAFLEGCWEPAARSIGQEN